MPKEALGGSGGFGPLQLALTLAHHLIGRGVGPQLVCHQQLRRVALLLEKLAHQPQCHAAVPPAPDQHVGHLALVIDGTPEIHPLAGDPYHHLVQMPAIAWLRTPPGDHRPELHHPAPHRFIGDLDPAFGKQVLDVAVAQGEAEGQPDRVLDDLGREAMTAVAGQGYDDTLPDPATAPDSVSVTIPWRRPDIRRSKWVNPGSSGDQSNCSA